MLHVALQLGVLLALLRCHSHHNCSAGLRRFLQPLAGLPSQLAQPVLYEAIWQLPVAQVAVAFARLYAVPHEAQLTRLVRLSRSRRRVSLQSPQPAEQLEH